MRNIASSDEIAAEKFRKERVQTYLSIETCKTLFFQNLNQNLQRLTFPISSNDILNKKKQKNKTKQNAGAERLGTTIVIREGLVMSILILSFAPKIFFLFSIFFFSKVALCYAVRKAYFWQRSVDHHITWFANESQIIT